jgi:START domain
MSSKIVLALILSLFTHLNSEDRNWEMKVNKEGIKIYMRPSVDSPIKEVKVECAVEATLSQLVTVLLDVNTTGEWVYATKSATLLKKISPSELYYHSEIEIPWPASNRDFIAHMKVKQDAHSKIVTIDGPNVPDYIPQKEGVVRIMVGSGKWILTPVGNKVKIEYYLLADPGGSIPAWLVNLFATKGPMESFRKLKTHVKKPVYNKAHLPFIVD